MGPSGERGVDESFYLLCFQVGIGLFLETC